MQKCIYIDTPYFTGGFPIDFLICILQRLWFSCKSSVRRR